MRATRCARWTGCARRSQSGLEARTSRRGACRGCSGGPSRHRPSCSRTRWWQRFVAELCSSCACGSGARAFSTARADQGEQLASSPGFSRLRQSLHDSVGRVGGEPPGSCCCCDSTACFIAARPAKLRSVLSHLARPPEMNAAALLESVKDAFYALAGSCCKTGALPRSPSSSSTNTPCTASRTVCTRSTKLTRPTRCRCDPQAERAQLQGAPPARGRRLQLCASSPTLSSLLRPLVLPARTR